MIPAANVMRFLRSFWGGCGFGLIIHLTLGEVNNLAKRLILKRPSIWLFDIQLSKTKAGSGG
jgi:hypothetical protein